MHKVIIGVDIGGSKILSGIITADGRVLVKKKQPTRPERSAGDIMDGICAAIRELMQITGTTPQDILGIAVGAPGPLDHITGVIKDPPNLNWRDLPLRYELSKRLGRQLLLENDANIAALGEWKFGSSKVSNHLLYMTVSTGIGGGIIIGGELYRGSDGGAGEFGRMIIQMSADDGGPVYGDIEGLASGTALALQAQQLIETGGGQALLEFCPTGKPITAREVGDAARRGIPEAIGIIHRAGQCLGIVVANLVNVFNPDRFVLGGGTALGLQDLWFESIQKYLETRVFTYLGSDLKIEFTTLGEDIGLLGCAAAVLQEVEKGRNIR